MLYLSTNFSNNDILPIHETIQNNLKQYGQNKRIINTLIYGPDGNGKYHLAYQILAHYFNIDISNLFKLKDYVFEYGEKSINYSGSLHHFEINIAHLPINLHYIIIELLITLTSTKNVLQQNYKIIVIRNFSMLQLHIQQQMRKIMEKMHRTSRLILITNNIATLDPSIQSRCLCIQVPAPSFLDCQLYIHHITSHYNHIQLSSDDIQLLITHSNYNLNIIDAFIQYKIINLNYDDLDIIKCYANQLFDLFTNNTNNHINTLCEICKDIISTQLPFNNIINYLFHLIAIHFHDINVYYQFIHNMGVILSKTIVGKNSDLYYEFILNECYQNYNQLLLHQQNTINHA